jgi:hypothetical protein
VRRGWTRGGGVVASVAFASSIAAAAPSKDASTKDDCITAAEKAQRLRRDTRLKSAREQLLVCSQTVCPAFVRNDCIQWLSDVENAMPSVTIHAVDPAGADVLHVRVLVDGQATATQDGAEIRVDPGPHVFRFEHDGDDPVEQSLLIREGERRRVVPVTLGRAAASKTPTRAGAETELPPPSAPSASSTSTSRALPLVLMAAGGIGLGAAAYLWISGLRDRSSLESSCAPTHSCSSSTVDSAHGKLVAGDIVGGLGIVLGGVGAWLYLSRPPPAPASGATPTGAVFGGYGRF